jgi:hypothetical protein
MRKTGEVFSMGNIQRAAVKDKKDDLNWAFAMGVRLATVR